MLVILVIFISQENTQLLGMLKSTNVVTSLPYYRHNNIQLSDFDNDDPKVNPKTRIFNSQIAIFVSLLDEKYQS